MKIPIVPVILCGGEGTRLWPMSRRQMPKQFLPLISQRTMLQETALRASRLPGAQAPIIVCSERHRFLAAEQLREINVVPARIILEPIAKNTAPALAVAALSINENSASGNMVMLVLPADHLIRDEAAFSNAATLGAAAAADGTIVTFGITPEGPESGYGYIERGDVMPHAGCFRVARFVEKPDPATARKFIAAGNFFWNSGMFIMTATRYLGELSRHRPRIVECTTAAWNARKDDDDFSRIDEASFGTCPADSIDYAVMEQISDAAVVPVDLGWSDVGSWATLWEASVKDKYGNSLRGDIDIHDTHNSYIRAESRLVAVIGLDNVIVVETSDAVLVTSRDKAQSVKDIVSRLSHDKRIEHLENHRVYRPWGYYEVIDDGKEGKMNFQVKRLMVKPGESISLQLHHRRAEHWIVASGIARITRGNEIFDLQHNQSTYIPVGMKHRLENPGKELLFIVEVQSGDYLGEDDIIRFEDRYNRP